MHFKHMGNMGKNVSKNKNSEAQLKFTVLIKKCKLMCKPKKYEKERKKIVTQYYFLRM